MTIPVKNIHPAVRGCRGWQQGLSSGGLADGTGKAPLYEWI